MKNNVIAASSNITGNIGGCEIKSVKIQESNDIFIINEKTITINSCTGETHDYSTWELTTGAGISFFLLIFILIIFIAYKVGD